MFSNRIFSLVPVAFVTFISAEEYRGQSASGGSTYERTGHEKGTAIVDQSAPFASGATSVGRFVPLDDGSVSIAPDRLFENEERQRVKFWEGTLGITGTGSTNSYEDREKKDEWNRTLNDEDLPIPWNRAAEPPAQRYPPIWSPLVNWWDVKETGTEIRRAGKDTACGPLPTPEWQPTAPFWWDLREFLPPDNLKFDSAFRESANHVHIIPTHAEAVASGPEAVLWVIRGPSSPSK